jgi:hypothetical protein
VQWRVWLGIVGEGKGCVEMGSMCEKGATKYVRALTSAPLEEFSFREIIISHPRLAAAWWSGAGKGKRRATEAGSCPAPLEGFGAPGWYI